MGCFMDDHVYVREMSMLNDLLAEIERHLDEIQKKLGRIVEIYESNNNGGCVRQHSSNLYAPHGRDFQ
jgi:hypothetical protein